MVRRTLANGRSSGQGPPRPCACSQSPLAAPGGAVATLATLQQELIVLQRETAPAGQAVGKSADLSLRKPIGEAVGKPVAQTIDEPTGQRVGEAVHQAVDDALAEDDATTLSTRREGLFVMNVGDIDAGNILLRDYINATVGVDELGAATHKSPKSLMRMFGPGGNPQAQPVRDRGPPQTKGCGSRQDGGAVTGGPC